ncbi:MAG: orotate phosphoribosyltransferase [Chthoniobacterales bacterium]
MSEKKNPISEAEIIELFEKTGALLSGHFILRSGLRSRRFFQCALLLQHTEIADQVCGLLADKLRIYEGVESVISPAVGGIVVGQEVARHLGKRHIFDEKNDRGGLVLRRGFEIREGERFVVAEDVVTRGGRVQETIDIVREHGGVVVAAASIVDRSGGNLPDFGCPFCRLVNLNIETFDPQNLPPDLENIPALKPGSK